MKRNIIVCLSLMTAMSCSVDKIEDVYSSGEILTIPVEIVDANGTRSYLDDSTAAWNFIWEDGDQVNCILTRLGRTIFNSTGTINVSDGKTTMKLGTTYSNGDVLYSWFSSGSGSATTSSAPMTIPAMQLSGVTSVSTPVFETFPLVLGNPAFATASYSQTSTKALGALTPNKGTLSFKISDYVAASKYYCKVGTGAAIALSPNSEGVCYVPVSFTSIKLGSKATSGSSTVKITVYSEDRPTNAASLTAVAKVSVKTVKSGRTTTYTYAINYSVSSVAAGIQGIWVIQEGPSVFTPVRNAMPLVATPLPISKTIAKKSTAFESLKFNMLGSVVKLQISASDASFAAGESIQSVTLTSTGQAIAGDFKYNLAGNKLTVSGLTGKTVTASLSDYDRVITCAGSTAVPVYMVVAPGTFSATLAIQTDKAEYTVALPETTFQRGEMKTIPVVLSGDTADVAALFDISDWNENNNDEYEF